MSELHTVEAYVVDAIKDERLPGELPGCPLSAGARRLLMAEIPVAVIDPTIELFEGMQTLPFTEPRPVAGYDPNDYRLRQPSAGHVRSFELLGPGMSREWRDEYGNTYTSINLKGMNFSRPGVMEHPTAVDQYVGWGLQESKIIQRVIRASKELCARGVATEKILALSEPKEYPWPQIDAATAAYTTVPLQEYKKRIVERYWQSLPEDKRTVETLADLTRKFNDMTFYVSMRAVDSPFRLNDAHRNENDARTELFEYINTYRLAEGEAPFDPGSDDDWIRYARSFVAPNLGQNLARMHPDLAHGFLHPMNITALGGVVDTDSVFGEPLRLGDEPVTPKDIAADLLTAADSLMNSVRTKDIKPYDMLLVNTFATAYMRTRLQLLQDPEKARREIGQVIEACEELLEAGEWQSSLSAAVGENFILPMLQLEYVSTFFTRSVPEFTPFTKAVEADISAYSRSETLPQIAGDYFEEHIDEYAERLLGDYLNELQEPGFDVTAAFIGGFGGKDIRKDMRDALTEELKLYFMGTWSEAAHKFIPDVIEPKLEQMLYFAHMAAFKTEFEVMADNLIATVLPNFKDRINKHADYDRPEPLLDGFESSPWPGISDGSLWNGIDEISFDDLMARLEQEELDFEIMEMPDSVIRHGGSYEFVIPDGERLRDVITDGLISGTHITVDDKISISVDAGSQGRPMYLAVIRNDGPESVGRIELYIPSKLIALLAKEHQATLQDAGNTLF